MSSLWQQIQEQTFDRQDGRRGYCGKGLVWSNHVRGTFGAWQAHHVNGTPTDHRPANCVCLCVNDPEDCHSFGHGNDTRRGTLLKRHDFAFWNG